MGGNGLLGAAMGLGLITLPRKSKYFGLSWTKYLREKIWKEEW